jgi:hypothetical protein
VIAVTGSEKVELEQLTEALTKRMDADMEEVEWDEDTEVALGDVRRKRFFLSSRMMWFLNLCNIIWKCQFLVC